MAGRLIIDGNSVYEMDEECERKACAGRTGRQRVQETEKMRRERNHRKRDSENGKEYPGPEA